MIATEQVLSERPLVIRRRVKWGDCDPAGVVYTPMFSEYVISAAELFTARCSAPRRNAPNTSRVLARPAARWRLTSGVHCGPTTNST